ncbi:MAG: neuraminidase [Promethearchaeota archaeon CR_4]|nr:MAG: neuraminidase [Candidatus Lokiarchaeota archaeon CR_4]
MHLQIFDIPNPWPSAQNSSIVQISENRFMATWYAGTQENAQNVCIACSYFTRDTGWTTPRMMLETPDSAGGNGVLFIDRGGKLWFFWNPLRDDHPPLVPIPLACTDNKYIQSSNQGQTWSDPVPLFSDQIGWNFKNKPIYLNNGFLLLPMYDTVQGRSLVAISENNGLSWSPSQFIETEQDRPVKEECPTPEADDEESIISIYQNSQPTLFQRKDETIVALFRTTNLGVIHKAISTDFGFTWSESEPTSLLNPDASIDCVKLENGDVVLAFNNSTKALSPLTLAVSQDEGEIWGGFKNLEDEATGEFHSPAILQDSQGRIHVTYTFNGTHIRHVILDETWLDA